MTGNHPNINIPSPQLLTPPPTTAILSDKRVVKTTGDKWQLNPTGTTHTLYFSRFRDICTPAFVNGLQWTCHCRLSKVSTQNTYNFLSLIFRYLDSLPERKDGLTDLLSGSNILNLKETNGRSFTALRGPLRDWAENGYYGLAPEVLDVLKRTNKVKSNTNRIKSVDTLCPKEGPLLEYEESLFNQALKDLYAETKITLHDYLLCKLTLVFGARPVQWSKTKIANLVVTQSSGQRSYGILIPWAKQSIKKKPVYFPLSLPLGRMLLEQAERIRLHFPKGSLPKGMTWDDLPLFPQLTGADLQIKNYQPRCSGTITSIIKRVGKTANIPNQRAEGGSRPIIINARRLRHTVGTRLATKGQYGGRDIADYLLQTYTNSMMSYVDLKEWLLENFDEYWNVRLEANAKVALGIMTADEAKKVGGPRITFSDDGRARKGVGNCGKTGCTARAPLACYGCAKFRPLLDAPHGQYLETLISERDRQLEFAPKHIDVYDTAIQHIRLVIEACIQKKAEGNDG